MSGTKRTCCSRAMVCFMALASTVFAWITYSPPDQRARMLRVVSRRPARRHSYVHTGAVWGALYIVYLWTIFGNGFRYGKPY